MPTTLLSSENGEGAQRAIQLAIQDAKIDANDIGYIMPMEHRQNLMMKMKASPSKIYLVPIYNLNISSTKSMTGHWCCGAIELIATVDAMNNNYIPQPLITIQTSHCDLNYTPNTPIEHLLIGHVQFFWIWRTNAVIIAKKFLD